MARRLSDPDNQALELTPGALDGITGSLIYPKIWDVFK